MNTASILKKGEFAMKNCEKFVSKLEKKVHVLQDTLTDLRNDLSHYDDTELRGFYGLDVVESVEDVLSMVWTEVERLELLVIEFQRENYTSSK